MVKDILAKAGIDCTRYNGHSFRIGAATTALAKGIPECTIQTLGIRHLADGKVMCEEGTLEFQEIN